MSLASLFHYLMLNIFRMLIHPSSGACDLFVELFHGLYYSGSMCVGVTLWFGWGGVVSGCGLKPASAYDFTFSLNSFLLIPIIQPVLFPRLTCLTKDNQSWAFSIFS